MRISINVAVDLVVKATRTALARRTTLRSCFAVEPIRNFLTTHPQLAN